MGNDFPRQGKVAFQLAREKFVRSSFKRRKSCSRAMLERVHWKNAPTSPFDHLRPSFEARVQGVVNTSLRGRMVGGGVVGWGINKVNPAHSGRPTTMMMTMRTARAKLMFPMHRFRVGTLENRERKREENPTL
ncbi:pleckstriny domain-containing family H member 1-like protein [Anopheles sinensis]|uniref:Pleckstriny domain-containing family H member 1-like protein n=1 Tax=Anopheles sinensis TaxID=74873 RepID=A0A084WCN5_ANOSI|nr:pleckstriny domain-containing family H member 1-like protein [Anopheles sinensis]